jgi:ribosomal protein S18 acetylase RimI-like enzyme
MSELTIRPFTAADIVSVTTLWQLVFPDDPSRNNPPDIIRRKLEVQPELFLVGIVNGNLIGTVLGGYDGFRGWIYHLAVNPTEQRHGYGSALVERIERQLYGMGCPKLNLQVRATNRATADFYQALGYAIEDHISLGKVLE